MSELVKLTSLPIGFSKVVGGKDGKTSYTWIVYANKNEEDKYINISKEPHFNGAQLPYMGIAANKEKPIDEATLEEIQEAIYSWSLIKGEDGESVVNYTWIVYAESVIFNDNNPIQVINITSNPTTNSKYIGIAYNRQTEKEDLSDWTIYNWSLIKGDQGEPGANGITYYTWVKYATDIYGNNMADEPYKDGVERRYIGLAFEHTKPEEQDPAASNDPGSYIWSLLVGKDGLTTYTWIRYSPNSDGSDMTKIPNENSRYIGIAANRLEDESSTEEDDKPSNYIWSLFKGEDGAQGPAGSSYRIECTESAITRGLVNLVKPIAIGFTAFKIEEEQETVLEIFSEDSGYTLDVYESESEGEGSKYYKIEDDRIFQIFDENMLALITTKVEIEDSNTTLGYGRGETKENINSLKVELKKDGIVVSVLFIPFLIDSDLMDLAQVVDDEVIIADGKVTGSAIVGDTIKAFHISAGAIITDHFASNRIVSNNFEGSTTNLTYTSKGSLLELNEGTLHLPNFYSRTIEEKEGNNNPTIRHEAGFKGSIEAQSGTITGQLRIGGEDTQVFIDGNENSLNAFLVGKKEDPTFCITKNGDMTATSGKIGGWTINNKSLTSDDSGLYSSNETGINTFDDSGNPKTEYARFYSGDKNASDSNFIVTNTGRLIANKAEITGSINAERGHISGKLFVGEENEGILIDGENSSISSAAYASGVSGWKISNDGTAEFQNAHIRGTLESVVFEANKVSAVGGDLYIAPTFLLKFDDITDFKVPQTNPWYSILFKGIAPFYEEDVYFPVLVEFDGIVNDKEHHFNNVMATCLNYGPDLIYIIIYQEQIPQGKLQDILSDITVIKMGASLDDGTMNHQYIQLTANYGPEGTTPYIDVCDYLETEIKPMPKVRLGNLSGITDSLFGGQLSGYGLYSNNAYLTGSLYLPKAGITNQAAVGYDGNGKYKASSSASEAIRIWAGGDAPAAGRDAAPFIVTQDGSLYATQGVFKGIVQAEDGYFNGTIRTAGVLIDNSEEEDKNHFFVGYKKDSDSYDDYVIDIGKEGLKIWEGGLKVYSDILSGWNVEGTSKDEFQADDLYGYKCNQTNTSNNNFNPYPYISAVDQGRLAVRDINIMSPIGKKSFSSIFSKQGALYFGTKLNDAEEGKFSISEASLYQESQQGNGIIKMSEGDRFEINKKGSSVFLDGTNVIADGTEFIISNSLTAARLSFNEKIKIEEVRDGSETIGFNFLIE